MAIHKKMNRFFQSQSIPVKTFGILFVTLLLANACTNRRTKFDASGSFESNEVIVSAKETGQLLSLKIHEGDRLQKDQPVGDIDVSNLALQREQIKATISALQEKLNVALPQIKITQKQVAVQQSQLDYLLKEKARTENLVKDNAATQKQLDDINAQVDAAYKQLDVSRQQIESYTSNSNIINRSILSEKKPLEKSLAQVEDQIAKGKITNPVAGVVLTQYAFEGEMTAVGKALYKIANIDTITLRAYVTGAQLPGIKIGQLVTVKIDQGEMYREYKGKIMWVSDKAEFTPKTIQTKDERQNLVYAIKVQVVNDGHIKIGMYGEVNF